MKLILLLFSALLIAVFPFFSIAQQLQKPEHDFHKTFRRCRADRTETIQANIYKPGKSINFFWNSFDWFYTGISRMSYTASGKISLQLDSGFQYSKTAYTYDAQDRQTEQLVQNFNSNSNLWENSQRQVTIFDAQGAVQEDRNEIWNGVAWSISSGEKNFRVYNQQNLPLEDLQQRWNSTDSVWENQNLETDFIYDNQFRLQSYVSKVWANTSWVNDEKSLWQYGPDNKPNLVILQEWNGTDFVDSTHIIDIVWASWNGNLSQSEPSRYTMQRLTGGNWVNFARFHITKDLNGSETFYTEVFENGNWRPESRSSYLIDEQQNPVVNLNEEYNLANQSFDTTYCFSFQNTYDAQGRILEQIMRTWDGELHTFNSLSRKVFSEHLVFSGMHSQVQGSTLNLVPNPVPSGGSMLISNAVGRYQIRELSGKVLEAGRLESGSGISVKNLRSGLYLIDIQNESNGRQVIRFAVN